MFFNELFFFFIKHILDCDASFRQGFRLRPLSEEHYINILTISFCPTVRLLRNVT